jgi:hypothetical protein
MESTNDVALAEAYAWAIQTIGLTICLCAQAKGQPIVSDQELRHCEEEAHNVAVQLRRQTLDECGFYPAASDYRLRLAGKVLSWCSEHRYWSIE